MNIVKSTGTFGFYTIISRLLGYLRDILIAISIVEVSLSKPGAIKKTNKGMNISIIKIIKNNVTINKLKTLVANSSDLPFPWESSDA